MKKGYLFISNSSKGTDEERASLAPVRITSFSKAPMNSAKRLGYELFMGVNRTYPEGLPCEDFDVTFYNQSSYRNMFAIKDNWHAFRNLNVLLKAHPEIEVIHCNTPIGGVMGRVVGRLRHVKTVIYTAHGFHFFKGAPFFNNTILKFIEYFLAFFTDAIITMNEEDFLAAKKFHLRKKGKVYFVPGVGVNSTAFDGFQIDVIAKRHALGLDANDVVAIAMGDLVKRKNYITTLKALTKANNPRVHFLICGEGNLQDQLESYAKEAGLDLNIHFLGFRKDIKELLMISDFFLFSSLQEGLPRSTMEAMSAGLPCVVSKIRGNVDLIDNQKGGFLCDVNDVDAFANAINVLASDKSLREEYGLYNREKIKQYDFDVVQNRIDEIYNDILN